MRFYANPSRDHVLTYVPRVPGEGKYRNTRNIFFVWHFHVVLLLRAWCSSRARIVWYIILPYLEDENFSRVFLTYISYRNHGRWTSPLRNVGSVWHIFLIRGSNSTRMFNIPGHRRKYSLHVFWQIKSLRLSNKARKTTVLKISLGRKNGCVKSLCS